MDDYKAFILNKIQSIILELLRINQEKRQESFNGKSSNIIFKPSYYKAAVFFESIMKSPQSIDDSIDNLYKKQMKIFNSNTNKGYNDDSKEIILQKVNELYYAKEGYKLEKKIANRNRTRKVMYRGPNYLKNNKNNNKRNRKTLKKQFAPMAPRINKIKNSNIPVNNMFVNKKIKNTTTYNDPQPLSPPSKVKNLIRRFETGTLNPNTPLPTTM